MVKKKTEAAAVCLTHNILPTDSRALRLSVKKHFKSIIMPERRRLKRKRLVYYLKIYDRNTLEIAGHLADLTVHGINMICEQPLESGIVMELKMTLPEEMDAKNEIALDVKSSWCKRDINPNFYTIGCELIGISEKDGKILRELMQEYSFRD